MNDSAPSKDTDRPLVTCHLNTESGWRGGEQQVLYLARGLRALGHEALIACKPGGELCRRAECEDFETYEFRWAGPVNPLASAQFAGFLKRRGVDVLHLHTGQAATFGGFVGRLRRTLPIVITRRVDFALSGGASLWFKYGGHISRVIAISHGVRDVLVQSGVAPERIDIVHSGIDLARWEGEWKPEDFRGRFSIPHGVPLVGSVGALTDHKAHRYLIDAVPRILEQHPGAHFVLVGDGELRAPLEEQAHRTEVSHHIHFTGFIEDVGNALAAMDVFVLSSHLEGLCTSILDAMAMGVPIVATAVGGVPDAVRDRETGLLVPPRDPEALAAGVCELLEDQALRAHVVARAGEVVRAEFSVEQMVRGTLETYRRVTGEKREQV